MAANPLDEKEIFQVAVEIRSPAERQAYLDRVCGDDQQLRGAVEALLQADEHAGGFLEEPAVDQHITLDAAPLSEGPGTLIGPYKLLQQIGEGGMGVVYMAEQAEPVERRVALKIIKPGMDSRQVIARFQAEEQALAVMDHPNIAKVFEAGATDTGRPYFVMELVRGVPITRYCDEHHLTPGQRLKLFVPVCHAVQHAHQKGIIHRDIKPTNVLVAEYDDRPVPKIIDFGVAKAIGQRLTERTMFTQLGQVVGTIDYMSPEQAKLNQLDVDTRTDVYSLGVLLYELLAGEMPFDRARLRAAAFEELLRIIREEEPPKPSTRLGSSQSLPSIAANRHIEPRKLSTLVRGELDWIVMKALEKDRARRYETANAFASDVQRYLDDEPVVACPPSAAYRFRKFARRNRRLVTTVAVIALILLVASLVSTWQAVRATQARDDAKLAERVAQQERLAAQQQRDRALGAERNAELALDTLRKAVDAGYRDVEALKTSQDLDRLRARDDFRQLVAALEKTVEAEQLATSSSGTDAEKLEDRQRAAGLLRELVAEQPGNLRHRQMLAAALFSTAMIQTGLRKYGEAERSLQNALEIRDGLRKQQPDKAHATIDQAEVRSALGRLYWDTDRRPEAHRLWQEVLLELHKVAVENPKDQALQKRIASCQREICGRYGTMGLWDLAATVAGHNAELKRLTAFQEDTNYAVLLAATGQHEACRDYYQYVGGCWREGSTGMPAIPEMIRTGLLLDPPVLQPEGCVNLAIEIAGTRQVGHPRWQHFPQVCLALAQYRASRYADALRTIETNPIHASWEATAEYGSKLLAGYLWALVAQGDGRNEFALAQLGRAEGLYRTICRSQLIAGRQELAPPFSSYFWDLAAAQVLRGEAWQKIKRQPPPDEPWWHLIQAQGYGLLGESRRADKEFAAAVAAAPDDREVWIARARVFEQLGDAARAEADRNQAAKLGASTKPSGATRPKD